MEAAVVVLATPEGSHRRLARGRGHQHVVVGDLRDAPGLRAEHEAVADAALPHELLVELAEPRQRALQAQVEVAAVGDGAARRVDPPRRARPRLDAPGEAIDGDARHQLAHARVGVAAGEHLEHQVELLARQLAVRVARPQLVVEVVGLALLGGDHRQHHLGEHVERRRDGLQRLDVLLERRRRHRRRAQQVAPEERVEAAARDGAYRMAGAADALHRARHRERALHQQHLVEVADVDAQLERAGGDEGGQPAILEAALDGEADLLRQRAVVRVGEVGGLPLVDEAHELLGHAPAVGEDERRAVLADALAKGLDEGAPEVLAALRSGHEAGHVRHRMRQSSIEIASSLRSSQ